jgi:uncharacterized membrane protein
MNRFEYLDGLRDALYGLPETAVAAIVADYERRFTERSAAGQSEEEIMASLGDPQQVAAEKRAARRPEATAQKLGFVNLVRMFFSLIGLSIFNLFMVVPSIVYAALLFAAYATSLAFYGAGILVTAASLAGVGTAGWHEQPEHMKTYVSDIATTPNAANTVGSANSASASAGNKTNDKANAKVDGAANAASKNTAASAGAASASGPAVAVSIQGDNGSSLDINESGIYVSDFEDDDFPHVVHLGSRFLDMSRPAQVAFGLGMLFGGIILFLLCLTVSKFSWVGLRRLAQMEFAVLKNA